MNEAMFEIIKMLKEISPQLWATVIKQVYMEASGDLLWAIALAIGAFFIAKQKSMHEDEFELLGVGTVIAALVSFGLLLYAIFQFINPEFYALRFLLYYVR